MLLVCMMAALCIGCRQFVKKDTKDEKVQDYQQKEEQVVNISTEESQEVIKDELTTDIPVQETMEPVETVMPQKEESLKETIPPGEETEEESQMDTEPTKEPEEVEERIEVQITPLPPQTTEIPITSAPTKEPQVTIEETPQPFIPETPVITQAPVQAETHVHTFEKAVWELPTCQKGGYYNNICKECGLVESVSQEPLPHEAEDIIIQEGNCMEDRVIRHICKNCGLQVESDTRYPLYDVHSWQKEEVDGVMVDYCEWCGVVK